MKTMNWAGRGAIALSCGLTLIGAPERITAQDVSIVASAVTLSSGAGGPAELYVELSDGAQHRITFDDGLVRIDESEVGTYEPGGSLARAWRGLLREVLEAGDGGVRGQLLAWEPDSGLDGADAESAARLSERFRSMLAPAPPATNTRSIEIRGGELRIAPGGLDFDELTRQLEALDDALEVLGEAGRAAGDALALIVHDDFALPADMQVGGNLALLEGRLDLQGDVGGDVLILDGTLVLHDGARIEGEVLQVGGDIELLGGEIEGEILADLPVADSRRERRAEDAPDVRADVEAIIASEQPRRTRSRRSPWGRVGHNFGQAVGGLFGALSAFIGLGVLGLLFVYFARTRLETVADTVRKEFAR